MGYIYQFFLKNKFENESITFSNKYDTCSFEYKSAKIDISKQTCDKLKSVYTSNNFNNHAFCILFRYQKSLGEKNEHLAVNKNTFLQLQKFFGGYPIMEMYASCINFTFWPYCCLYFDIEQFFRGVGSFFNYRDFKENVIYTLNPPFDNFIMEKTMKRLIRILDKYKNILFLIFIPVWDNEGRKTLGLPIKPEYGEYKTLSILKKSSYIKYHKIIHRDDIAYVEHISSKKVYASNTHFIVFSNRTDLNLVGIEHISFNPRDYL